VDDAACSQESGAVGSDGEELADEASRLVFGEADRQLPPSLVTADEAKYWLIVLFAAESS
jgi:hypothetical protein